MSQPVDLRTTEDVLEWMLLAEEPARRHPNVDLLPTVQAIAAAMRLRAVWLAHRDKLVRFAAIAAADRPHYVTVNRHTLAKALREFIADMAKAEDEP